MVPNKVVVRVVFTRPRKPGLVALAIRLLTWAPYSHAAMRLGNRYLEAVDSGVEWTTPAVFDAKNVIKAEFIVTLDDRQTALLWDAVTQYVGVQYDWPGVVGLAWHRIKHYLGIGAKKNALHTGAKRIFCSELCYRLLFAAGVCPRVPDADLLDPKRLLRLLEVCEQIIRCR